MKKLRNLVSAYWGDNSPDVYKGQGMEGPGYYYQPFGKAPAFLGRTLDIATQALAVDIELRKEQSLLF